MFAVAMGEPDGFAGPFTEIIQFSSSCFAASGRLDINDVRRMKREYSFDALATYDSPDGEHFIDSPAFTGNYRAAKYLYPLFIALFDIVMDIDPIAYLEVRYLFLQVPAFNGIHNLRFHLCISSLLK
jgi:hypothetical protein